jgi:hypothetical protein
LVSTSVPIKFQLTDYNGKYVSSTSAVTSLQVLNAQGTDVLTNPGCTALRYDSTSNQLMANWQTKGLPAGSYILRLVLADGTTQTKTVQLVTNGNGSNAQATDGSDVSSGSTAGQLLGGDVELYVDNSNGDLTPDELARIQDAVNAVDATIAPYGVAITEVPDPTLANVILNMGSTSAVGGYAQGILGCFSPTGAITLIQGWNWYTGSNPQQIGAGQYDFQTTVTHELGHALGLGESSNPTSAMYGTLTPGTVIRGLTAADLNIPYDEAGADPQRAAPLPGHPAVLSGSSLATSDPAWVGLSTVAPVILTDSGVSFPRAAVSPTAPVIMPLLSDVRGVGAGAALRDSGRTTVDLVFVPGIFPTNLGVDLPALGGLPAVGLEGGGSLPQKSLADWGTRSAFGLRPGLSGGDGGGWNATASGSSADAEEPDSGSGTDPDSVDLFFSRPEGDALREEV